MKYLLLLMVCTGCVSFEKYQNEVSEKELWRSADFTCQLALEASSLTCDNQLKSIQFEYEELLKQCKK